MQAEDPTRPHRKQDRASLSLKSLICNMSIALPCHKSSCAMCGKWEEENSVFKSHVQRMGRWLSRQRLPCTHEFQSSGSQRPDECWVAWRPTYNSSAQTVGTGQLDSVPRWVDSPVSVSSGLHRNTCLNVQTGKQSRDTSDVNPRPLHSYTYAPTHICFKKIPNSLMPSTHGEYS